jgi:hypothetical protein
MQRVLQRKCACGGNSGKDDECEKCRGERLQRKAGTPQAARQPGAMAPSIVHEALRSSGQPLDGTTRRFMESRFDFDFGDVRVHADAQAARSAGAVGASAYAVGRDVVFGAGQYAPNTQKGRGILAHELAHVVQQNPTSGNVFQGGLTIGPSDGAAEREAQGVSASIVAGSRPNAEIHSSPRQIQRTDVQDCTDEQKKGITDAVNAAGPGITATVNSISQPKLTPAANKALVAYFGASGPGKAASIAAKLGKINSGIPGVTIECESPGSLFYGHFCDENLAYVRPVPAFFGLGNIHTCQPQFNNLTPTQRAETIIHEGAHRFAGAGDKAYYTLDCGETPETKALSDDQRMDNADSFGCLVQTLGGI